MKKWNDIAEDLGWSISDCDDGYELQMGTPAGEDFSLYVHKEKDIEKQLVELCEDFDVEEHVEMWIDAKRSGVTGIPDLWTLIEDATYIAEDMLRPLATEIRRLDR